MTNEFVIAVALMGKNIKTCETIDQLFVMADWVDRCITPAIYLNDTAFDVHQARHSLLTEIHCKKEEIYGIGDEFLVPSKKSF